MTTKWCDMHLANGKKVVGLWKHPDEEESEWLCDECYQSVVKFYRQFVKTGRDSNAF